MDPRDIALIDELAPRNPELAHLWQEHRDLEQRLTSLGKHSYLTTEEKLEQRTLKKQKLAGRDRIESILADHRD